MHVVDWPSLVSSLLLLLIHSNFHYRSRWNTIPLRTSNCTGPRRSDNQKDKFCPGFWLIWWTHNSWGVQPCGGEAWRVPCWTRHLREQELWCVRLFFILLSGFSKFIPAIRLWHYSEKLSGNLFLGEVCGDKFPIWGGKWECHNLALLLPEKLNRSRLVLSLLYLTTVGENWYLKGLTLSHEGCRCCGLLFCKWFYDWSVSKYVRVLCTS